MVCFSKLRQHYGCNNRLKQFQHNLVEKILQKEEDNKPSLSSIAEALQEAIYSNNVEIVEMILRLSGDKSLSQDVIFLSILDGLAREKRTFGKINFNDFSYLYTVIEMSGTNTPSSTAISQILTLVSEEYDRSHSKDNPWSTIIDKILSLNGETNQMRMRF